MSTEPVRVEDASTGYLANAEGQGVPAGYKRTNAGIIPEDWDVTSLGALGRTLSGGTPRSSDARFWGGDIPWVSSKDMKVTRLRDALDHVTPLAIGNGTRIVQAGTILMVVRGMSLVHSFPVAVVEGPVAFNQDLKAFVPHAAHSGEFILRWLEVNETRILLLATEATHGTKRLPTGDLLGIAVPLPSVQEQRAIAEALSDVDGLLGVLEALIAKKRAIKQAAMQQLLTGKIRLPGFSGAWETKRLGDVLTVRHGRSQRDVAVSDGKYPILASGGEIGRTDSFLYDKPSVLIGRKGTIDDPHYISAPFWTVDTLFYTEVAEGASAKFLFYKFCVISWWSYNEASGVPSLNARTIEGIETSLPEADEQEAIAAVLSDMDAEIAALEQRRDKTRQIKQGMMQQLLTGRVRLV